MEIPAGRHRAGARLPIALGGLRRRGERHTRGGDHAVVFEPGVGREIRHVVAEVIVETAVARAAGNRFSPVEVGGCIARLRIGLRAGAHDRAPVPAEVPLADARGAVALLLQHRRERELGVERRRVEAVDDAVEFPPVKPSREQRVAARRADARRAVRIGETQALAGELVEVRRANFRLGILNREIAVTHVVGVENDDVGAVGSCSAGGNRTEQEHEEQSAGNDSGEHRRSGRVKGEGEIRTCP